MGVNANHVPRWLPISKPYQTGVFVAFLWISLRRCDPRYQEKLWILVGIPPPCFLTDRILAATFLLEVFRNR